MKAVVMIAALMIVFLTACRNTGANPPDGPNYGAPPEPPNISIQQYLTEFSELGDPFSAAVLQTGILDELEPEMVYTMFIPPMAWFERAGITKEAFLAHPQLEEIVAYHFLTSSLGDLSLPFEPGTQLPTFQGQTISLSKKGDSYFLNDTVKLVTLPIALRGTYKVDVLEVDRLLSRRRHARVSGIARMNSRW